MNIGNYTKKLSDWMEYKKYSEESIKNYVSCVGKFLKYFNGSVTKPSEISNNIITKIPSPISNIKIN